MNLNRRSSWRSGEVRSGVCTPIVLALMLGLTSQAQSASYLPRIGGSGGSQFDTPCPPTQILNGFELRGGNEVDAIRPLCASAYGADEIAPPVFSSDSGLVEISPRIGFIPAQMRSAPGWNGGTGGSIQRVLCPSLTPVVLGVRVDFEGIDTITVESIFIFCGRVTAEPQELGTYPSAQFEGKHHQMSPGWLGIGIDGEAAKTGWSRQRCPPGEVAVGMHGKAGAWVDSMGLICDAPRIAPLPPGKLPRVKPGARVGTAERSTLSICEAAQQARARNSPAAAGLEAQCEAQRPRVAAGARVETSRPSGPPMPICDAATAARDRNSPAAPGLLAQCLAVGGHLNPPAATGAAAMADLAARGTLMTEGDPLAAELRNQQTDDRVRRGLEIGLAAAEGQTEWGPGKEKILASLPPAEQEGFKIAVAFSFDRNRNTDLATVGAAISETDAILAAARLAEPDARYWLGFDIATGIFGDPALGARGNTEEGTGAHAIRDQLSLPAQRGFKAAVELHLSRRY